MSDSTVRKIVLATDLGEESEDLFAHCLALSLAARAELSLVHIVEAEGEDAAWRRLPTVRALLEAWAVLPPEATPEQFEQLGIRVHPLEFSPTGDTSGILTPATVALAVARRVADLKPDLLVLGTHARHGFDRLFQPSVSEPVAREIHRDTLFIPAGAHGFVDRSSGRVRIKRVLVPITSEVAQQPLIDQLVRMLGAFGVGECSFVFVHVGPDDTLPSLSLPERSDWFWKTDRRSGSVVEQILEAEVEHRPDLVAMATEGRHGLFDSLAGSTTERVLRRTRTPLFTVPVS